jgi:aspartate ammonia-lyase
MQQSDVRIEHDLLGDLPVPVNAYFGVHTQRALTEFPIARTPISSSSELINALACIKQTCAQTNHDLGLPFKHHLDAIEQAFVEFQNARLHEQFVVDVIQGGAGTSTNMNANEVIAYLALEYMGPSKGEYQHLHPNEQGSMSRSTNDVYPTALKIAAYRGILRLVEAMAYLQVVFEEKTEEFKDVLKMGRTQLQDAVPITLGQEFSTYAVMLGENEARLIDAAALVRKINLGATALPQLND